MSKGGDIRMIHPPTQRNELVPAIDEAALRSLGWPSEKDLDLTQICDACLGMGVIDGKVCWHCEGEIEDPTKGLG